MGYFRGVVDESISRFVEAFLALPLVVIAILAVIALRLGDRDLVIILVIGIVFTPLIARTVRAAVLLERELDYVSAARLRGERAPYIMFVEILPNVTAADRGRVHRAARIRRVHDRHAVVPGLRRRSRRRPTGALDIATNYGQVSAGYWWEVLFDAARDRLAGDRRQPDRRRGRGGDRSMSADAAERRAAPAATDALDGRRTSTSPTACAAATRRSCATCRSASAAASLMAWSASRAAASRRSRWRSSATWPRNGRVSARLDRDRRPGRARDERRPSCGSCAPARCRWSTRSRAAR